MAATQSICSVEDCEQSRVSRGYCNMHYLRVLQRGEPGPAKQLTFKPRTQLDEPCAVEGCPLTACARGWCRTHYSQWRRQGAVTPLSINTFCETCGDLFDEPSRRRRFCGNSCQQIMAKRGVRPRATECNLCGSSIDLVARRSSGRLQQSNVSICLDCRNLSTRRYPVTRDWLAERDGNGCHLCSTEIDFSIAYPDAMSASTDHLTPVSLGGSSDPSNLALAHLVCNIRKGNRVPI